MTSCKSVNLASCGCENATLFQGSCVYDTWANLPFLHTFLQLTDEFKNTFRLLHNRAIQTDVYLTLDITFIAHC